MAALPQPSPVHLAFGDVLRGARTHAKLSQEGLGLSCGLDRTYLSLLERGLRQPTLTTLFALSERLGVTPELLVARTRKLLEERGIQATAKVPGRK